MKDFNFMTITDQEWDYPYGMPIEKIESLEGKKLSSTEYAGYFYLDDEERGKRGIYESLEEGRVSLRNIIDISN